MQPARQIIQKKIPLSEIRTDFGNPKRIQKKELERLKFSILENGDFGVILVNEKNQVISGNQRIAAIRQILKENPSLFEFNEIDCKVLVGYTENEQKRILLEANATRGEYVLAELEEFLAGTDLKMDDFKISSKLFAKEQKENLKEDMFDNEEFEEISLPLIVAVDPEEWHMFQDLKRNLGLKDDHAAIRKLIKTIHKREKTND